MSDETIGPALTPEEWAAGGKDKLDLLDDGSENPAIWRAELESDDVSVSWWRVKDPAQPADGLLIGREVVQGADRLHALAALALHGQPFGPKAEWVGLLIDGAHVLANLDDGSESDTARACREVADFLAALLPPEGT